MYFSSRPKKSSQVGPLLPTRQSLRLRNKDPDGIQLPDQPLEISQPVDEHVSDNKKCYKLEGALCMQTKSEIFSGKLSSI